MTKPESLQRLKKATKPTKATKARKPDVAKPITGKLESVPGPKASAQELKDHNRMVQTALATRHYDDVLLTCHWCCDMSKELTISRPGARGKHLFCSKPCATAAAAYEQIRAPKETQPSETDAPPKTEWRPGKQKVGRKTRARKVIETKDKCSQNLHKMDEANRYEYNGTVYCRECRKASRAKSKAK